MLATKIIGVIGLLILIVGTILVSSKKKKKEIKVYTLYIIGGICLFIYSFQLGDIIFITLQGIFILSAVYGLIKINKKIKNK